MQGLRINKTSLKRLWWFSIVVASYQSPGRSVVVIYPWHVTHAYSSATINRIMPNFYHVLPTWLQQPVHTLSMPINTVPHAAFICLLDTKQEVLFLTTVKPAGWGSRFWTQNPLNWITAQSVSLMTRLKQKPPTYTEIFNPSIYICCLFCSQLMRQQLKHGSQDIPFHSYLFQLLWEDSKTFTGQPRDIISPVGPGFLPGSPPIWKCPENLPRKASRGHPY